MHNWNRFAAWLIAIVFFAAMSSCNEEKDVQMKAPSAKKIRKEFREFGNTRVDDYYWLRNREDKEVIAYLEAENAYTREMMKGTEDLQEKLFEEIVGRIKQTDMSVPYDLNGYQYYTRYEEGGEYPVYCRRKLEKDAAEEVMLDGNLMAKDYPYFKIGSWEVSQNNEMLVYSIDTVSRRKYTLHFKNLRTGEVSEESILNTTGNMTWANDNRTIFYTIMDETLRPHKIMKHTLGQPVEKDELVFLEDDATFSCYVYKTKSGKYVVITSSSTLSDEYRVLAADNPGGEFSIFQKRQRDLEYSIAHQGDRWLIRTNMGAKNFRLMETGEKHTAKRYWKELIPNRGHVLLEGVDEFQDYYVVTERENGLARFRIFDVKKDTEHYVAFREEDYSAYTSSNPEYNSGLLRYGYTSLKTPTTIYDYDMHRRESLLRKQYEVLGEYHPEDYITERIYVTSRDGVQVPVSMVYRNGFQKDGSRPLLLYGYGSYGYSMESTFVSSRLSLLDRGFIFAIAHIRGGEEMGRQWYEDGKLLNKKNTFFDFIDCGKYLVENKYTSNDRLFGFGGSAGGLLIGAVVNYEPSLFEGVIAAVPFVDVVTTMLDESIPLTTGEYDEWGNPNEEEYYRYMLSYSPYDQVSRQEYPHMLVTTGLHDSQVQYWEPAKWVARLREMKTGNNMLLLWTNMDFGHSGASGRFERYRETALEYAFMLQLIGIEE